MTSTATIHFTTLCSSRREAFNDPGNTQQILSFSQFPSTCCGTGTKLYSAHSLRHDKHSHSMTATAHSSYPNHAGPPSSVHISGYSIVHLFLLFVLPSFFFLRSHTLCAVCDRSRPPASCFSKPRSDRVRRTEEDKTHLPGYCSQDVGNNRTSTE